MSDQTKLSDDAAVNAESAAKLVSELKRYRVIETRDTCRLIEHGSGELCYYHKVVALIERHATTQTQATHGEGEAVALLELLQTKPRVSRFDGDAYDILWRGPVGKALVHLDSDTHEVSFSFKANTHPAPSPTAAPALGELGKELIDHSEVLATVCGDCYTDQEDIDKAIPLMRQAAAALSGVAAQGDGVPKGWTITPQDDAILVRGPGGDAYLSDEKHNSPVSVIVLFRLAKALLAAQGDGKAP